MGLHSTVLAARNARLEAQTRLGPGFVARVLEPSPPANDQPDWYADDPVSAGEGGGGLRIVAPTSAGDITWSAYCESHPDLSEWAAARWLGPWRRLSALPDGFADTCAGLHQVAYFVVAPARYQANTKLGLRYTKGGFGTPFFGADEQIRVEGSELIRQRGEDVESHRLSTVGEAARFLGLIHRPNWFPNFRDPLVPTDPVRSLNLDPGCVVALSDWFGFVTSILEEVRARARSSQQASRVQLWPEHFDPALELGDPVSGVRASLGGSPGDRHHPEPYLYVSAWGEVDRTNPAWNDPNFNGASLSYQELVGAPDQRASAFDFFHRLVGVLEGSS